MAADSRLLEPPRNDPRLQQQLRPLLSRRSLLLVAAPSVLVLTTASAPRADQAIRFQLGVSGRFATSQSWSSCSRGPSCFLREVCFPISLEQDGLPVIPEVVPWVRRRPLDGGLRAEVEMDFRTHVDGTPAHGANSGSSKPSATGRLTPARARLLSPFASPDTDPYARKLSFYQGRKMDFTVLDRYNLENLFVEPHASDSQHLRRARSGAIDEPRAMDSFVEVDVHELGRIKHCGGGSDNSRDENGVCGVAKYLTWEQESPSGPADGGVAGDAKQNAQGKFLFVML